jgi:arsenate reductase (thioredoxin)
MAARRYNVLFLCTGNSARSVIAEAVLNKLGEGKFRAFSAGSHPKGTVNPNAARLLEEQGYDASGYRSKSWSEFANPGAPPFDFIITVCDDAAGEACPVWPGKPATAHWGISDPAAAQGRPEYITEAFHEAYRLLVDRIRALVALPIETLDSDQLKAKLRAIGGMPGATAKARAES